MLLFNRRRLLKIACAGLAGVYFPIHAQTYPAHPVVSMPEVREKFTALGAEPVGNISEEFGAFTKAELASRIVKQSGAKVD